MFDNLFEECDGLFEECDGLFEACDDLVEACDDLCMYNLRRDRDPAHVDSHLPSTSTCDGLGQLVLPT